MDLLTADLSEFLRANAERRHQAYRTRRGEPDAVPVVKLFNPVGAATWLATELDADGDTLFGLADLGFGCPELGSFSLREISALRLPFGFGIERDLDFEGAVSLSVWADTARRAGSIIAAEQLIRASRADPDTQLPPSDPGGG